MSKKISLGIIILAAGEGSRMLGGPPKPLRELAGKTLLAYNLDLAHLWATQVEALSDNKARVANIALVLNENLATNPALSNIVSSYPSTPPIEQAVQGQARGTADAVFCAMEQCPGIENCDFLLILYADNPLITVESLNILLNRVMSFAKKPQIMDLDLINLAFYTENNNRYGRLHLDSANKIYHIQEFKDFIATLQLNIAKDSLEAQINSPKTKAARELRAKLFPPEQLYNSGVMLISQAALRDFRAFMRNHNGNSGNNSGSNVSNADNNIALDYHPTATLGFASDHPKSPSKELYLTDVVNFVYQSRTLAKAEYIIIPEQEALGCNSNAELALLEAIVQHKLRSAALQNGVIMPAPDTVFFSHDTRIGAGTSIEPYVIIGKNVTIGKNCHILAFSHIEGATIDDGAQIGPFARIRPHSDIGAEVRVGNFVEVKNTSLAPRVKAGHLSYLGDANIGESVNIGAGTVICNFDGERKHRTTIEAGTFIGANNSIISPRHIGKSCKTAAGTVIEQDVPEGNLAIGRVPQLNKPRRK